MCDWRSSGTPGGGGSSFASLHLNIHLVDLLLEVGLGNVTLQLEGRRDQVVLEGAELGPENELLGAFETAELLLSGKLLHVLGNSSLEVSVSAQLGEGLSFESYT